MPLIRPINNPVPFATSGLKNVIPVPTAFGGAASMTNGFPAETMTPIVAGGTPPAGQDMNGILHQLSSHSVWLNAGGMYRFDAALAAAIGGYSAGAVLQTDDGLSAYVSTVDGNMINPNAANPTGWNPWSGRALALLTRKESELPIHTIISIYEVLTVAQFAQRMGYGTWAVFSAGRVVIGAGQTTDVRGETLTFGVGDFAGEFKHEQTEAELAQHNHTTDARFDKLTAHFPDIENDPNFIAQTTAAFNRQGGDELAIGTDGTGTTLFMQLSALKPAGNSDPMNVVQPYIVASCFIRTA
jgi:microcystin-dependent protein